MQIIAHRGAHRDKTEENTPLAFRRAIVLGFSMMELDVRLTKDGHLIVHHDSKIRHDGRQIKIRDHLFENFVADGICTNDLVRFGQHRKCPALELVLDVFLPQIKINVELKDKNSGKIFAELLKEMVDSYKQFQSGEILKNLIVSSFEENELIAMKKQFPQIETALLINSLHFPLCSVDRKKLDCLKRFGVEGIHLPYQRASKELVDYLKYQHGFVIRVYTINEPKGLFCCFSLGVDGVFTDKPEALSWLSVQQKPILQTVPG